MVENGPKWSRMIIWRVLGRLGRFLEVQNGRRIVQERSLEVLVRVSGGSQRVPGVSWDGPERSWEGLWRSSEGAWGRLGRS